MLRQFFRNLDQTLLNGSIRDYRAKLRLMADTAELDSTSSHKYYVFYEKNNLDPISLLCDKYGSDKGGVKTDERPYPWLSHTYADFYSRLFSHCRESVRNVFECGLGTNNPSIVSSMGLNGRPGASLRVWRDYFPNAMIYGADIDREILFEEDRIKTFYIDQLDSNAIEAFWRNVPEANFDFMLDDGLHTFEAGISLFTNSIGRLAKFGIYVIEDVLLTDLMRYKRYFDNTNFVVDYVTLSRPNVGLGDNNLVIIRKNS